MNASGGSIQFQSGSDGTTFFVNLLKHHATEAKDEPEENHEPNLLTRIKTLVVDDEPMIREVLQDLLSDIGCEVTTHSSAKSALDDLKSTDFDLIISDVTMPGMDGVSFLQEVDTNELSPKAVKYLLSGGVNRELTDKVKNFQLGKVDGFIKKPFSQQDLREIVDQARKQHKHIA